MRRVVRVANSALEAEPMVRGLALGRAVVARDDGASVAVFGRHGLGQDGEVKVAELGLHIDTGLVAQRALVRSLLVLLQAMPVDRVATFHADNRFRRVEEILTADGTVAIFGPLDALVVGGGHGDASHASFAVEEVLP